MLLIVKLSGLGLKVTSLLCHYMDQKMLSCIKLKKLRIILKMHILQEPEKTLIKMTMSTIVTKLLKTKELPISIIKTIATGKLVYNCFH